MTDEANPFHSMISITRDENSPLSFGRSGSNPPYVYAIQIKCRNTWDTPLSLKEVTFGSSSANFHVVQVMDEKPIAPGADFAVVCRLPPVEGSAMENGLFFEDFRKQFVSFSVKIELTDGSYGVWHFPADEVEAMLEAGAKSVAR